MAKSYDPAELVHSARAGDRVALGRLLTALESRSESVPALTREMAAHPGAAHVVGVTGAPGVGKSTTTSELVSYWRKQGHRVAVLAVDPSSPFTGGALLGDRIRMTDHATDEGVFIRSMAARGQLGGLAAAAPAAARALAACGFGKVIIETVGVGQSEVDIVRYADSVAILLAPGMGDRIQAVKAGLLEIGDVFAVNKADRDGARSTQRELESMIAMKPLGATEWHPPVVSVIATRGQGITELAEALDDHLSHGITSGVLAARRRSRLLAEILSLATEMWGRRIAKNRAETETLVDEVLSGSLDEYSAASKLFEMVAWR